MRHLIWSLGPLVAYPEPFSQTPLTDVNVGQEAARTNGSPTHAAPVDIDARLSAYDANASDLAHFITV